MLYFLQKLLQGKASLFGFLAGFGAILAYFLGRKDAKVKAKTEQLNEQIRSIKDDSKRVVTVQKKQAEIAAQPTPDRDAIHDWLHDISDKDKS